MSYTVTHRQAGVTRSDSVGLLRHSFRDVDRKNGVEISHTNEMIDSDRTVWNVSRFYRDGVEVELHKTGDLIRELDARIAAHPVYVTKKDGTKVQRKLAKTTGVLREIIIQFDPEFTKSSVENIQGELMDDETAVARQEEVKRFFAVATEYYGNLYGKHNLFASSEHWDETSPHMHLYLTPIDEQGRFRQESFIKSGRGSKSGMALNDKAFREYLNDNGFDVDRVKRDEFTSKLSKDALTKLSEQKKSLDQREKDVDKRRDEVLGNYSYVKKREDKVETRETEVAEREKAVKKRETEVTEREIAGETIEIRIAQLETALRNHEAAVEQREAKVTERETAVKQREAEVAGLKERETEVVKREATVAEKEAAVQALSAQAKQAKLDAEQEAVRIKSKATTKADEIVSDAEEKASTIISSARANAQSQAQQIVQRVREREEELEKIIKEYKTKLAALADGFTRKAVNYLSKQVAIKTITPYVGESKAEEIFDAERQELLTQLSKGDIWKGKDPLSPEQKQALDNKTVGEHELAEQRASEEVRRQLGAIYQNQQNNQSSRGYSREFGGW